MDYLTSWTIQGAHCGPSELGTSFHTALPDEIQIDHFLNTDRQTDRQTLDKIFHSVWIKFTPGEKVLNDSFESDNFCCFFSNTGAPKTTLSM